MNTDHDSAQVDAWVLETLDEMKAQNVVDIDVRGLSSVTDHMIVCSGRSDRHVKAIADALIVAAKQHDNPPLSVEGLTHGEWVLVDLADAIVHVMLPDLRAFYDIESLWQVPDPKSAVADD